jgi:glutamate-ammonia-ligase adenylyltransferase
MECGIKEEKEKNMSHEISLEQVQSWSLFVERETNRFPELLAETHWQTAYAQGELVQRIHADLVASDSLAKLNQRLRYHRRAEMVRIAIRDLKGLAEVEETLQDLSDLADALVSGALDWHYHVLTQRYGTPIGQESGEPQKLIVLGMGKLGGQELNFSSDIDLIFVYPEKGQTEGADRAIPNDQFFIRLGQALNKSLTEFSPDGTVYRVDMRLRPFGQSGPLAVSFAEMETYYQVHGRAWERYALVKARIIAGDHEKGQELFEILRPFVYRKYVDFSAIEALRDLKAMINVEVQKKDMHRNIKLGPGGIREIEFIVQAFQLVHGGREKPLQDRRLMPMLSVLMERHYIDETTQQRLLEAYIFLRRAENRLQEWSDQQTHDLPTEARQQQALAESMGFDDYTAFKAALDVHLTFVQSEFDQVFADEAQDAVTDKTLKEVCLSDEIVSAGLQSLALEQPDEVADKINKFMASRAYTHASAEAVERFKAVLPLVLTELSQVDNQTLALERSLSVLASVMNRSVYLVLLKENLQAIKHLLQLCALSAWMAEVLVKYPALLDQLLDESILYEPLDLIGLKQEASAILAETFDDDEAFMNQIRQWKHAQVFRVAAADITGHLPIMKVSDYLTWIAEAVLEATTEYAWQFMQKRSGLPGGYEPQAGMPFLIIGYGKLGGIELGYGSDLDIVFLYDELNPSAMSDGPKALENNLYFMRLTQKVISLLTTFMPTGVLYEVDTRLRPNGASGMIVTDLAAFEAYEKNKAWVWEHQALVRTRAIVGSEQAQTHFYDFKKTFIAQPRSLDDLKGEVVSMRHKMRASLDKTSAEWFDLKQGAGGIVDIEFMVQYLVLGFAHQYESLTDWSDNIRLLETIKSVGLLDAERADQLIDAYRVYRNRYHRLALQNEKALVSTEEFVEEREVVSAAWQALMEPK